MSIRHSQVGLLILALLALLLLSVDAKRPPSSRSASTRPAPRPESTTTRKRRVVVEEEEFDDDDDDSATSILDSSLLQDEDEDEDDADIVVQAVVKPRKGAPPRRRPPPQATRKRRYEPTDEYEQDEDEFMQENEEDDAFLYDDEDQEDDFYEQPPRRRQPPRKPPTAAAAARGPPSRYPRRPPPGAGKRAVVPYGRAPKRGSFLSSIRDNLPDANYVKNAVGSTIKTARESTSGLSANLYREIKGLTSSELEQVMLKATMPDDTPVKGKHVERLVGVTYQISSRYDIYDAVLRKLWGKMVEKDWRTTLKALYILHRFSADGAPEHAPALKARLRELRRTRDPKRKDKYFNSKQLLAGDAKPDNIKYRAFMSRYAHYVLLRAQCFGGMFDEIANEPKPVVDKKKKGSPATTAASKPITSTCLRMEYYDAAVALLKSGMACQMKDGEDCENTAIAIERVASDMIALTTAVALALNRALKSDEVIKNNDAALLYKWVQFYSKEMLPQTRAMVKKTASKLDAYGLFLPSRMGATVSPDLIKKGLGLGEQDEGDDESLETEASVATPKVPKKTTAAAPKAAQEEEFEEEYEYDEEEYYDDDEEL